MKSHKRDAYNVRCLAQPMPWNQHCCCCCCCCYFLCSHFWKLLGLKFVKHPTNKKVVDQKSTSKYMRTCTNGSVYWIVPDEFVPLKYGYDIRSYNHMFISVYFQYVLACILVACFTSKGLAHILRFVSSIKNIFFLMENSQRTKIVGGFMQTKMFERLMKSLN